MPGFDRTGPMGAGAMTGGGRGRCNATGAADADPRSGGFGRGRGFGRGYRRFAGYGRGFGRRIAWDYATAGAMPPGDPLNYLKTEAEYLEQRLQAVKKRIDDLQPSKD